MDIFDELEIYTGQKNICFIASIEVTMRCNARCNFCLLKRFINKYKLDEEWNLNDLELLSYQLRKLGVYHIQLTGGEPFVRKDIIEIIRIFRKNHFAITLNTNGMLIQDKDIEILKTLGLMMVIVSFHTMNEKTFELIWGLQRDFLGRQLKNIKNMKNSGINVVVNVVLTKHNIDEFPEIKSYFADLGIDVIWDIVQPQIGLSRDSIWELIPTKNQLRKFYNNLKNLPHHIGSHLLCNAGKNHLAFSSTGEIFPCGRLRVPLGKFPTDLVNLFKNHPYLKYLRRLKDHDLKQCVNCVNRDFCQICIGNNLNINSDLTNPSKDTCYKGKILREVYYERRKSMDSI